MDSSKYPSSILPNKNDNVRFYTIKIEGCIVKKMNKQFELALGYKDINTYFLCQLNGLILSNILYLLVITAGIIWGLKSFYWRSTLLTTTNGFINNLTQRT